MLQTSQKDERPPYIRFERRAVEDRAASERDRQYRAKDVDFVLITPPGSKDVVVRVAEDYTVYLETQAREGRIPETWPLRYRDSLTAWRSGQELPVEGTPIRGWPVISPAQQANIIGANILTVEDLAQANSDARRRIGMGANELAEKAVVYLKAVSGPAAAGHEIASLKAQVKSLNNQISAMSETIQKLKQESAQEAV